MVTENVLNKSNLALVKINFLLFAATTGSEIRLLFPESFSYLHKSHHLNGKQTFMQLFVANVPAAASSTNGDFGEWNAFPGGQMPATAQAADMSGTDLFGAMTAGHSAAAPVTALAPASTPGSDLASANLFDMMGPTQSLTTSQSLHVSMSSTQNMTTTVLPQSKSQVCMTAPVHTRILSKLFIAIYIVARLISGMNRIQVVIVKG